MIDALTGYRIDIEKQRLHYVEAEKLVKDKMQQLRNVSFYVIFIPQVLR